jgi:hypothetical protein
LAPSSERGRSSGRRTTRGCPTSRTGAATRRYSIGRWTSRSTPTRRSRAR